jgi:ribosome maturation factor RimP
VARSEVSPAVVAICEAAAEALQLELLDVRFGAARRRRLLTVVVDRENGGVSLDLITEISRDISAALDEADLVEGGYTLEVSSAGIERQLYRPADYRRFAGRDVSVRCHEQIEGSRHLEGHIESAGDDSFTLARPLGSPLTILYDQVASANLKVDWAEELRKAGAS